MKKKILHIIWSLESGGCENFLLRVLPRLAGFDQKVLTLKYRGVLAKEFEKRGIPVESLGGKWWELISRVKSFKPGVVVTYLFHADLLGRVYLGLFSRYKPIPYLRTTYNFSRYKWVRLFEKLTSFMVPKYLANSRSVKDFYLNRLSVDGRKITVVPNGVDIKDFDLPKSRRENFRKRMGVGGDDLVMICVANFHPNKGHKFLLEAFERLYEKNKKIWLWLVGEGEERKKMEAMADNFKSKKKIVFWGRRRDVSVWLASSDIFVLPTLFEGMSNAILEAMASGLPVVTTNIEENREILNEGKEALLVKTSSEGQLFLALTRLVENKGLRLELANNARNKAKGYDVELISRRLGEFFRSVVSEQ